jgi:predicted NAD/FAD-binding protein
MRIAIIGSGISGLASGYMLSRRHDVTLFEANDYLGGHTHTHAVEHNGLEYAIDTGFIVHNRANYPLLTALFDELGVTSKSTNMSFSVHNASNGLEYNATNLNTLFCQRRNLLSPRFIGMVRDLLRFYREAPALLTMSEPGPGLGDYLDQHRYGTAFRDEHLVPMASALWSAPAERILSFPARYLVQFMANHQMLQVSDRPEWLVVQGGSATYVRAMQARWKVNTRMSCPVWSVRRLDNEVSIVSHEGRQQFDQVIMACHSDQALALLSDPSDQECDILGAMTYQTNDTVLHTDASLLPNRRQAWAAWNAYIPAGQGDACTVSYCMNLLQGVTSRDPFVVTLNRSDAIDSSKILRRMCYRHPVYTAASVAAQARKHEISGKRRTWFAGAYWGWGFHEDGMRSAVEIVKALDGDQAVSGRVEAPQSAPVRSSAPATRDTGVNV